MYNMMKQIKRYCNIYGLFFRYCLATEMQYKFNFFMGIILDVIFFFTKMIYAIIVYNNNVSVNGLTPDAVFLYIGTFSIIQGIYTTLFLVNFNHTLPDSIQSGDLDIYMIKPISLQFLVSTKAVEVSTMLPDLIGGIIVIAIAWYRLRISFSFVHILGYIFLIVVGLMIAYAIFFSVQLISFYFIKVNAISEISNELFSLNNMPHVIYNKSIQFIGIYVLPIFLITNFGPKFLLDQLKFGEFLWILCVAILLMFLCRKLWKVVINKYSSASS